MTENKYKITVNACFLAYIVQAIVNNFAPLLFVTFQNEFNIPLSKITVLVTVNFLIQLLLIWFQQNLLTKSDISHQ